MKTNLADTARLLLLGVSLGALVMAAPAFAQEPDEEDIDIEVEEDSDADEAIVVTGTRVAGRSPTEAISPVDVFAGEALSRQGSFDVIDQLSRITPSFNTQRFPIADGTAFVRPANLRNLSPDQTLVLINGNRRHRSALVNLQVEPLGTVNQGAQAVDFGLIPSIAVERIEVLRDGASAQYGSDAIAGVINVILKENREGFTITAQRGEFYEGDGERLNIAGNLGLPLGDTGFFNISAEYINSDTTSRGSQRPDAAAVAAVVGNAAVPFNGLGQRWGDPEVEGFRLFFNGAVEAGDGVTAYAHGSYASQDTESGFFYRTPVGIPGVTPRGTLFVDGDGDGLADPVDQGIVDDILERGLNPNDFVTADPTSPSGFVALNPIAAQFPGGYNPTFGAENRDFEGVIGAKGTTHFGLFWDVSGRFGENELTYILQNSINPGLGATSPLNFRPGQLAQRELGVNLDFVYPVEFDFLASPLNIAFGAEWRREAYEIGIGDPESFEFGPTGLLFGVGSDGFQGDNPDAAGTFRSRNYAGYVDLETDVTDWLRVGAAGRFEDNSDFGNTFDWKISARVQPLDWFAIRGTVNTGFRAPTPGQINTLDVTTTAAADGSLVPLGTFPVNSDAAIALGATPLDAEESFNITGGLIFTPWENFSLTIDYYNIDVDDRIALATVNVDPGSPEQQALIDAGVQGANLLGTVSFFTNAVDTTVEGIDVAAIWDVDFGRFGDATFDVRHAYNEQTVDSVNAGTIGAERVFDLENQLPNHRSVFTATYRSPWLVDGLVRVNRYGGWEDASFGEQSTFGSEWLVDLEVAVNLHDRFRFAVGAENIGDNFPDAEQNGTLNFLGATRPITSPFGFNGGFWYLRATANF